MKFCAASAFVIAMAISSCASAEPKRFCLSQLAEPQNVRELVDQSAFVALYRVESVTESEYDTTIADRSQIADSVEALAKRFEADRHRSFNYNLIDATSIIGKAPSRLTVRGSNPPTTIPGEFFFIGERHRKIVEDGALILGTTPLSKDETGNCLALPRMMPGYSYLVFGGVQNRAAFEPILDVQFDALFLEVKRIAAENAASPQ